MPGNDHIDTAPKDVIGDDTDLREMRDALRAGKSVTLAYDGHVYVSQDATAPMTAEQEHFIESKLGHVIELARDGYGVSVHPDGTISADRADHLSKVLYDPNLELSEQQRGLIQRGVSEGAQVRVHSDGRVEYFRARNAPPPPPGEAAGLQQAIDDEINSGRLLAALRSGETMSANPDGSLDYIKTAPGPAPVDFPEVVSTTHEPLTTADQLEAEARSLELGASAARLAQAEDYEVAATAGTIKRDAALRQQKADEFTATEADKMAADKDALAGSIRTEQADLAKRAIEARDSGDLTRAEELAEKWGRLNIEARVADQEAAAARAAAQVSRDDAARHGREFDQYEAETRGAFTQQHKLENALDSQEDQARVYQRAAAEMREAERLDAAYADLSSRGVADAEKVRDAAAQHRASAEALRHEAQGYDTIGTPAASVDTPAAPGEQVASMDESDVPADDVLAPESDAIAMSAVDVSSPDEVEMPAMDVSTPEEIDMPAMDFSATDDVASAPDAADDLSTDVFDA